MRTLARPNIEWVWRIDTPEEQFAAMHIRDATTAYAEARLKRQGRSSDGQAWCIVDPWLEHNGRVYARIRWHCDISIPVLIVQDLTAKDPRFHYLTHPELPIQECYADPAAKLDPNAPPPLAPAQRQYDEKAGGYPGTFSELANPGEPVPRPLSEPVVQLAPVAADAETVTLPPPSIDEAVVTPPVLSPPPSLGTDKTPLVRSDGSARTADGTPIVRGLDVMVHLPDAYNGLGIVTRGRPNTYGRIHVRGKDGRTLCCLPTQLTAVEPSPLPPIVPGASLTGDEPFAATGPQGPEGRPGESPEAQEAHP